MQRSEKQDENSYCALHEKPPNEAQSVPDWQILDRPAQISRFLPATLCSLFISISLFGTALVNVREMAQQGQQGSAAVGFAWMTVIWFP